MSPANTPRVEAPAGYSLEVRRTIKAPRERVFQAWTSPEELSKWHAPNAAMSVPVVEVDLRVGGRYRITMQSPDGKEYPVSGTYRVVEPPRKLAYTWCWHYEEEFESLVTIEFLDRGASTEIVLRHEALPTEALCKSHEHGWNGILDRVVLAY